MVTRMKTNLHEFTLILYSRFFHAFVFSWLINFLVFLIVPYLTYLKPVMIQKLYSVDLLQLPTAKKEEKIVKKERPPVPKIGKDTENINTQAKESPPEEPQVYELGDLDVIPQVLYMVKPKYPEPLRLSGKEGRLVLKFMINYFGYVEKITVLEHATHPLFEEVAMEAVKKWRFTPPKVKGKPASVWFILPIKFELE